MRLQEIELTNWRNFKFATAKFDGDIIYVLGANASGKSNFLDAFRFLRDISKKTNNGLQTALENRGGFRKVRCLHARGSGAGGGTDVGIKVTLGEGDTKWIYNLKINLPGRGQRDIPIVKKEEVLKISEGSVSPILQRPKANDASSEDSEQLQVTHLEHPATNKNFRVLADFFSAITYVHVVPQLLKFGERIGGHTLEEDPFGQAFMQRLADTPKATRSSRLKRISENLRLIDPTLESLEFVTDNSGAPHLQKRFKHYRKNPAKQLEDQFSDGTLRLVALLWLLLEESGAPLLLEEPELSLNEEIVKDLHELFHKLTQKKRNQQFRQVIVTTHSYALLSNPGIGAEGIFIIDAEDEGSGLRPPSEAETSALKSGLSPAEVVYPRPTQFLLDV